MVQKTKKNKTKTQHTGVTCWTTLYDKQTQTTGAKDKSNIVFMRKS